MTQKILIGIGAVFIILQFFRPEKNLSNDQANDISTAYEVPAEIATILENKCRDCHSNYTDYPWYTNIQPVLWWVNGKIENAKGRMNLSEYAAEDIAFQYRRFNSISRDAEEQSMPLPEYTWLGLHPEAEWTEAEIQLVMDWAAEQRAYLESMYPADTLNPPRGGPGPGGPPSQTGDQD